MDNYNEQEKAYEALLREIETLDTTIPEELSGTVETILEQLGPKKKRLAKPFLKTVAGVGLLIVLLSGLIYSNNSFASFAKEVPLLNYLVEFMTTDAGTENAMFHDYPILDPIVVTDGPYTLTLSNMLIDEERMTFTSTLEGPYFTEGQAYEDMKGEGMDETIEESQWHKPNGAPIYSYMISVENEVVDAELNSYESYNQNKVNIKFNRLNPDPIQSILEQEGGLTFKCTVYEEKGDVEEVIHSFNTFMVPISEADILPNRYVNINQSIDWKEGNLQLDELVVSPSKMVLNGHLTSKEGILSVGLEAIEWLDDSGGIYGSPAISRIGGENGEVSYQVIPSIYYDKVNELILRYSAYFYELDHEVYHLSREDNYPITYDYYGHEFIITAVEQEEEELRIDYEIDDESEFSFNSIELTGYESQHRQTAYTDMNKDGVDEHSYSVYFEVGEEKNFTFKLEAPKLIVQQKGMVHIPIQYEE